MSLWFRRSQKCVLQGDTNVGTGTLALRASAEAYEMSTYRLDKLLAPRAIALIGASPRPASVGRMILKNLRDAGFEGPVELVNPNYPEIDGIRAVRDVSELPAAPDLAIVAAPPPAVPEIIATAAAKGGQAAIIITAGLGHGPGSLAAAARQAARAHGHAARRPQLPGGAGAPRQAQCELRRAHAAQRRPRSDLAIRRHRGRPGRMGGCASGRIFRGRLARRPDRRRFR